MDIKLVAKTLNTKQFNERFEKSNQGYMDKITDKIYFCPHDLGFQFSQDDCLETNKCNEC